MTEEELKQFVEELNKDYKDNYSACDQHFNEPDVGYVLNSFADFVIRKWIKEMK